MSLSTVMSIRGFIAGVRKYRMWWYWLPPMVAFRSRQLCSTAKMPANATPAQPADTFKTCKVISCCLPVKLLVCALDCDQGGRGWIHHAGAEISTELHADRINKTWAVQALHVAVPPA